MKDGDEFCGVAFLAHDGGDYKLAPYEEITEEQYNELKSKKCYHLILNYYMKLKLKQ